MKSRFAQRLNMNIPKMSKSWSKYCAFAGFGAALVGGSSIVLARSVAPRQKGELSKSAIPCTLGFHPELYEYILEHIGETPLQTKLRESVSEKPGAIMMGAADETQFLAWLCQLIGAKKVFEVGVYRGTTTLALALALPEDGKVVGLDLHKDGVVGETENAWKEAGVFDKIDLRIGPAVDSLKKMIDDGEEGTYDLCFIDADKINIEAYYESALKLIRKGGVIAVDNTLWEGYAAKPETRADFAINRLNEQIKKDPRVKATMLAVADGCYLCRKL